MDFQIGNYLVICREALHSVTLQDLCSHYKALSDHLEILTSMTQLVSTMEGFEYKDAYHRVSELVNATRDNLYRVIIASYSLNAFDICLSFVDANAHGSSFNFRHFNKFVIDIADRFGVNIKFRAVVRLWLLIHKYRREITRFSAGERERESGEFMIINEFNQVFTGCNIRCWLSSNSKESEEVFLRNLGCVSLGFEG